MLKGLKDVHINYVHPVKDQQKIVPHFGLKINLLLNVNVFIKPD